MEFEKFLIDNKIVPKDKAKYYVNWADKYLHGINYRAEAIDQRTISYFLNSMSKDKRYEDWQIKQADNAVRMYVTNYLKLNIQPQVQQKSGEVAPPARLGWEEAVLKYKECLRLRHYSYSTEKTYLECIGKFADYIRKDNVLDISDDDLHACGAEEAGGGGEPAGQAGEGRMNKRMTNNRKSNYEVKYARCYRSGWLGGVPRLFMRSGRHTRCVPVQP